jgi:hypothetical protein
VFPSSLCTKASLYWEGFINDGIKDAKSENAMPIPGFQIIIII